MKYCGNCGNEIQSGAAACLNCGRLVESISSTNIEENSTLLKVVVGGVSLFNPLIGAVLYYAFRKSNPKLAKLANLCSWLSIVLLIVLGMFLFTLGSTF